MLCNTSYDHIKMKLHKMAWILSLFVVADIGLYRALGDVGGHTLFAAMSQLKDLWHNEIIIAQILKNMVTKCENSPMSVHM